MKIAGAARLFDLLSYLLIAFMIRGRDAFHNMPEVIFCWKYQVIKRSIYLKDHRRYNFMLQIGFGTFSVSKIRNAELKSLKRVVFTRLGLLRHHRKFQFAKKFV